MKYLLNNEELNLLNLQLADKMQEIFDSYGITYTTNNRMMRACCPIHEGDNKTAFNMYITGHTLVGNWYCRTHNCQMDYTSTPIGLLRGLMSKFEFKGKKVDFYKTIERAVKLTGFKTSGKKTPDIELEKNRFVNTAKIHLLDTTMTGGEITREHVQRGLLIPSPAFIKKGFSADILTKYDIGDCLSTDITKEMYHRTVVPIYDETHKFMLGCTGRSYYGKCELCKNYHSPGKCPQEQFAWQYSKWRHSKTLKTEKCLFNFWFAKSIISKTGTAILVESPGNVLKLEEAGIHIGLATFGTHLTDFQKALLNSTGCLNVVIIGDNDEAGRKYNENLVDLCKREYNCYTVNISGTDIADMNIDDIKKEICPLLQKLKAI